MASMHSPLGPPGTPIEPAQFDYVWKWFAYHADQRVKLFNYMLVVFGVFATATVASADKGMAEVAFVLCLVAGVLALIFSRLDWRNECLLRWGEDALEQLEINWLFQSYIGSQVHAKKVYGAVPAILWRARHERPGGASARDRRPSWLRAPWARIHRVWLWLIAYICGAWAGKHRVWLRLIAHMMALLFFGAAWGIWCHADSIRMRSPRHHESQPAVQCTCRPPAIPFVPSCRCGKKSNHDDTTARRSELQRIPEA